MNLLRPIDALLITREGSPDDGRHRLVCTNDCSVAETPVRISWFSATTCRLQDCQGAWAEGVETWLKLPGMVPRGVAADRSGEDMVCTFRHVLGTAELDMLMRIPPPSRTWQPTRTRCKIF